MSNPKPLNQRKRYRRWYKLDKEHSPKRPTGVCIKCPECKGNGGGMVSYGENGSEYSECHVCLDVLWISAKHGRKLRWHARREAYYGAAAYWVYFQDEPDKSEYPICALRPTHRLNTQKSDRRGGRRFIRQGAYDGMTRDKDL